MPNQRSQSVNSCVGSTLRHRSTEQRQNAATHSKVQPRRDIEGLTRVDPRMASATAPCKSINRARDVTEMNEVHEDDGVR